MLRVLAVANIGLKRSSDSAIEQFVFLRVNVSVAAVKMESSTVDCAVDGVDEDGEGGGVRGAESMTLKKLSMPF